MTTFVTGGSGHLGANVVRQLLGAGHRVRVLCRPRSNNAALDGLDVERVEGDLSQPSRLLEWLDGCEHVVHLAALVSVRELDAQTMVSANIDATRHLMAAALRAGVRRVVHCSSLGTVGRDEHGTCDGSRFPTPLRPAMLYDRTKLWAELEVFRAAARGLDACILNPSGLIGPHDFKPSIIGQTILDFAHGRLPAYVRGSHDFVPVVDVARAHVRALEHGRRGERYVLNGEVLELRQILAWLSELTGRPQPRWGIPPSWILPWAGVKDWVERTLAPQRVPRFTRHSIELLRDPKHPSSPDAQRDLGWAPGSVRDALADAVAWLRAAGRIVS